MQSIEKNTSYHLHLSYALYFLCINSIAVVRILMTDTIGIQQPQQKKNKKQKKNKQMKWNEKYA